MLADVTVEISTKDRYDVLTLCLSAIANQTLSPKNVIIFDDGQQADLRGHPIYSNLFRTLTRKGITWQVAFGERKGQVANHQKMLEVAQTEWIWRVDDDNIPEADVLQKLFIHTFDPKVGAVAGSVLHPHNEFPEDTTSSSIKDVYFKYATQFHRFNGIKEVEHLYSTFLYRKSAAMPGYCKELSQVGHREETIFSHEMFRRGWKLLVNGAAITWHYQHSVGGIRSFNNGKLWEQDERVFAKKIKEWDVETNNYFLVYLNNGIGDHFVFKQILKEVINKNPNKQIVIAACYPDVFFDCPEVKIVSLHSGDILARGDVDKYNVYKIGAETKSKKPLIEMFRSIYVK